MGYAAKVARIIRQHGENVRQARLTAGEKAAIVAAVEEPGALDDPSRVHRLN
jgi:hypothetical protein